MFRFENATGDAKQDSWGFAADTVFRNSLHEIKGLRSLPDPTLDYGLRKLQIKAGSSISLTQAQELGTLIGAQEVVAGSYRHEGGQWQLALRVVNVSTGDSTNLTASAADWFTLRDQLAEPMLAAFGVNSTDAERERMMRHWTKSSVALDWLNRAREANKEKRPAATWEEDARRALDADSNFAEAYVVLAASEGTQGRYSAAKTALGKALKLNPELTRAYLGLGSVALVSGKPDESAAPLNTAIQLDPDNFDAFDRLGQLATQQKNFPEAARNFSRAVQLSPFQASLHASLGRAFAVQEKHDDALRELAVAEELVIEGDINTEETLAWTYAYLDNVPSAIKHYEKLLAAAHKAGVNSKRIQESEKELKRLKALKQ